MKNESHNPVGFGTDIVSDIREILRVSRANAVVQINGTMIRAYWEIGRRIVEEEQNGKLRAQYGERTLLELSKRLSTLGRGFSSRSLAFYRKFYTDYPDWKILHPWVQNLTWSHIMILLRVDDLTARQWYMNEASTQMWSKRTLDRNVSTQYYYRLLSSPAPDAVKSEMLAKTQDQHGSCSPEDFIKSPIVTEFLGFPKDFSYTEKELESALIDHLKEFIMEMGKGYAFVERQQRIVTDTQDYYIDLVFYNYLMKCFVLVDLKTGKLTHQDVGQMDMYRRMYDDLKCTRGDNPTIGIVLCSETSDTIARYSVLYDNERLYAAKYLPFLPKEEELIQEIERQKQFFIEQRERD